MTSKVPQLIITLTPDGALAVELPGHMATRRKIVLRTKDAGDTLLRMLSAQSRDEFEIGLDGAPTTAQVRHWERHNIWADSHCRFCLAEGRAKPDHKRVKRIEVIMKRADGVEVRKVRAGVKGSAICTKTAKDMGL